LLSSSLYIEGIKPNSSIVSTNVGFLTSLFDSILIELGFLSFSSFFNSIIEFYITKFLFIDLKMLFIKLRLIKYNENVIPVRTKKIL